MKKARDGSEDPRAMVQALFDATLQHQGLCAGASGVELDALRITIDIGAPMTVMFNAVPNERRTGFLGSFTEHNLQATDAAALVSAVNRFVVAIHKGLPERSKHAVMLNEVVALRGLPGDPRPRGLAILLDPTECSARLVVVVPGAEPIVIGKAVVAELSH